MTGPVLEVSVDEHVALWTPSLAEFEQWRAVVVAQLGRPLALVAIRVCGEEEMLDLNRRFRDRDRTTNVLSFPAELPAGLPYEFLGDLVLCANVIALEASAQHKAESAHWAHLTVHGLLHLAGFDHVDTGDAQVMEALEVDILAEFGIADPYS